MEIFRVKAFQDNYLWVVANGSREAFVVDPGDAAPVQQLLEEKQLTLSAIVLTHHHPDHIGGVDQLQQRFQCEVYGPRSNNIPQVTRPLADGDSLTLLGADFQVIAVPGHTLDHIAYFCESLDGEPTLFCGDTLFAGGCGRMFEGTPPQMQASLARLRKLPPQTRVYCAHEYTQANLAFASAVEPDNTELGARVEDVAALRAKDQPTVPSTIALELATNPFLRTDQAPVVRAAATRLGRSPANEAEVFAAIRGWKDNF